MLKKHYDLYHKIYGAKLVEATLDEIFDHLKNEDEVDLTNYYVTIDSNSVSHGYKEKFNLRENGVITIAGTIKTQPAIYRLNEVEIPKSGFVEINRKSSVIDVFAKDNKCFLAILTNTLAVKEKRKFLVLKALDETTNPALTYIGSTQSENSNQRLYVFEK